MTKHECRMYEGMTKHEARMHVLSGVFVILHSDFFRHSSFGIRHFRPVLNPNEKIEPINVAEEM